MIVGIVGLIGSGKDTIAQMMLNAAEDGVKDSFAASLKDMTAAVFGWDRAMLEGDTIHNRMMREQVDSYWSVKLGRPNVTPRWALQYIGTEVMRNNLSETIWLDSFGSRQAKRDPNQLVVVSDARFRNELNLIKNCGGKLIWVQRGELPEWYEYAAEANKTNNMEHFDEGGKFDYVHASERDWAGYNMFDMIIKNDSTLDDLKGKVNNIKLWWGIK